MGMKVIRLPFLSYKLGLMIEIVFQRRLSIACATQVADTLCPHLGLRPLIGNKVTLIFEIRGIDLLVVNNNKY